jgi:hypothetical protein
MDGKSLGDGLVTPSKWNTKGRHYLGLLCHTQVYAMDSGLWSPQALKVHIRLFLFFTSKGFQGIVAGQGHDQMIPTEALECHKVYLCLPSYNRRTPSLKYAWIRVPWVLTNIMIEPASEMQNRMEILYNGFPKIWGEIIMYLFTPIIRSWWSQWVVMAAHHSC